MYINTYFFVYTFGPFLWLLGLCFSFFLLFRRCCCAGLVSFGIRGGSYVVGTVTAEEVLNGEDPFQNLISGAGWLVRAGVNHVEASARDGHLDILRKNGGGGEGETSGDSSGGGGGGPAVDGDDDETAEGAGAGDGGWLEDVLVAKLARTAIGHDSEGRLILLQVRQGRGGV